MAHSTRGFVLFASARMHAGLTRDGAETFAGAFGASPLALEASIHVRESAERGRDASQHIPDVIPTG